MIRKLTVAMAILGMAACSHPLDDPHQRAQELDAQGDGQLAQSQVAAAHGSYLQALGFDAADAHAAAGAALTGLVGLPDSQPVTDLLDECGQPHFDVEHTIFGPSGLLAQAALARSGTAPVQMQLQSSAAAAFQAVGFTADHVRATYYAATSGGYDSLYVNAENSSPGNPDGEQYVILSLNLDDLYPGDAVATPLTDGTTIDLAQHPGDIVSADTSAAYFSRATSGTLVFHGTPAVGSAMRIEFHAVTLTGCVGTTCDATLQLDGEIDSTVTAPVRIADELVPFGTLHDQQESRIRPLVVAAIDACGASLTADQLVAKVSALAPALDEIRGELDVAIAGSASFTLPKDLLHTRADLPLNATDLQALRSGVHAAKAAIALGTRYRYLATPFAQLVGDQQEWGYVPPNGDLGLVPARDFLLQPLTDDLNANFLNVDGAQDLSAMQTELDAALADLAQVLASTSTGPGVLDLHSATAAPFVAQLADAVNALRSSQGGFQAAPRNPGYGVNLEAFFSAPPDRQLILERAGLSQLFSVTAGDPDGGSAYERNDHMDAALPDSPAELATWSGGAVTVPEDARSTTCLADSDCPAGNTCGATGACFPNDFHLVDPSVQPNTVRAVLSPAAADLADLFGE